MSMEPESDGAVAAPSQEGQAEARAAQAERPVLEEMVDMKMTSPAELSGSLVAASVVSVDEAGRSVLLRLGTTSFGASLDAALDLSVVRTARITGERLIAQREGDRWVVLGALRTAPVPGVDEGDEFTLRARRITIVAEHEASMRAGAASFVLRAQGVVETIAKDITSRAAHVHKIVGRMLRLN